MLLSIYINWIIWLSVRIELFFLVKKIWVVVNSFKAVKKMVTMTIKSGYFSGRKKSNQIIVEAPVFFLQLIPIDFLLQ